MQVYTYPLGLKYNPDNTRYSTWNEITEPIKNSFIKLELKTAITVVAVSLLIGKLGFVSELEFVWMVYYAGSSWGVLCLVYV